MAQLVELLDVQLRNLTPGGKDSAARSLTKVLLPKEAGVQNEAKLSLPASVFTGLELTQDK